MEKPKVNFIDRTIEFFSPDAGLRRVRARVILDAVRNFDGAAKGSRFNGWKRRGGSANALLAGSRQAIVNASRDLGRNNPYAVGAIRGAVNNTIGFGIRAQWRYSGEGKKRANKAVNDMWWYWAHTTDCDYNGQYDLAGLQRMAFKTERESGEVLIRRIRRKSEEGQIPFQLQVLECDYLDDTKDGDLTSGGRIVQGVELDSKDRVKGYWIYEQHPGEVGTLRGNYKSNFVPAKDVIHMFLPERAGQMRGYPSAAPVITRLKDFDDYEDAQLTRQKIAACFSVFVHDSEPLSKSGDGLTHIGVQKNENGSYSEYLAPGIIEHLPPGKQVTFGSPPGVQNDGYSRGVLLAIATGYGVTYEVMVGDYSNVNYSSGRMGWIEFHRNIDTWRNIMIIPQMLNRIVGWFEESLVLRGQDITELEVKWTPPRRTMIDPTKEIPANIKSVRAGFQTVRDIISENGGDYEETYSRWEDDAKEFDKRGLVFDTDPRRVSVSGQVQQDKNTTPEPGAEDGDKNSGVE